MNSIFLIKCTCFNDIRKTYVKDYYCNRVSVFFKYLQMIQSQDKDILINMAKYIKQAMNARTVLFNNIDK